MPELDNLIGTILAYSLPNKAAVLAADHEAIATAILTMLGHPDTPSLPGDKLQQIVTQIGAIFGASGHVSSLRVAAALEHVMQEVLHKPRTRLNLAALFYNTLYFLYWCSSGNLESQKGFGPGVVLPFATWVRARVPRPAKPLPMPRRGAPLRLVYLTQFANTAPGNAHLEVHQQLMLSLAAHRGTRYRLSVYAWMFHDEQTAPPLEAVGVRVRRFPGAECSDQVAAIVKALAEDGVDILLTDMNSALPAVLFERRVAPIQVYYQLGMPYWPIGDIDRIFRVWGGDPLAVGFDPAICRMLNGPWVKEIYAPPVDQAALAAERARLPKARRLLGNYGRLAKITPEWLNIAAELLKRHSDLAIAVGGTGGSSAIRTFAAAHDLPSHRFMLIDEYVDGHLWGHILDGFLDTFPQMGGASCREVIAKGGPVINMLSPEMPNLANERLPALTATTEVEYLNVASRLTKDDEFLKSCRAATEEMFARMPTRADYAAAFDDGIADTLAGMRARTFGGRLHRFFFGRP